MKQLKRCNTCAFKNKNAKDEPCWTCMAHGSDYSEWKDEKEKKEGMTDGGR